MDDIREALEAAWRRVKDDVLANRDELRRRVVRRERPSLRRPPRCWCVAVRAGDTRLRVPLVDVQPQEAVRSGREGANRVTLDRQAVVALCERVKVDGLTLDEAAARL